MMLLSSALKHINYYLPGLSQAAEGGGTSYVGSGAPDPQAPAAGTRPNGHKLLAIMKNLLHGDPLW